MLQKPTGKAEASAGSSGVNFFSRADLSMAELLLASLSHCGSFFIINFCWKWFTYYLFFKAMMLSLRLIFLFSFHPVTQLGVTHAPRQGTLEDTLRQTRVWNESSWDTEGNLASGDSFQRALIARDYLLIRCNYRFF